MEDSIASTSCSFHEYIPWKLSWAFIYPYVLPQDYHKGTPTSIRSTSTGRFTKFHGNFRGSQYTSMEICGSRCTSMGISWTLVEVYSFPCKLVEASMEVHESFHCRWKWKLPLLPSIAASTNIFRGNFHDLPYTPTYFHLLPRVSQASSCFHKTQSNPNPNPSSNPKLELSSWKLAFQLSWKLVVDRSFHGSG